MAYRFIPICTVLGSLVLASCDPVYGIHAGKIVPGPLPDDRCIVAALKGTPGVLNVRTEIIANDGWRVAGNGPTHGSPTRYFSYQIASDFSPTLMTEENEGEKKYYVSHYMIRMHGPIPREDTDLALSIMQSVEQRVAHQCGLPIDSGMNHTCSPNCLPEDE